MRLRKESVKAPVKETRREPPPEFANLGFHLLEPIAHTKRYAITNVDSLGVIERFTFAEITREAAQWAQLLRQNGLQPGDRVVIVAGREWGWRCALLGTIRAGGVAVPCPASLPLHEIRTVAEHAGASLLVALRPRPDLVELDGRRALTIDDLDAVDPARALEQPPHRTDARDIALILYAWHDLDLTGTMHTHASLLAQADASEHWLGVDADERIWATIDDGSGPSIWLLLAAWRRAASIVVVDLELDSEAKLELLDRLRPAAVWFADDEYRMLGSAEVPPWVDLRSIRRALVDTEETEGAISFATAFGAGLVPVFALDELGVVAGWPAGHESRADARTAQPTPGVQFAVVGGDGTELPPGEVGDVAVRSDAPTLFTGYAGREGRSRSAEWFRFGWRGALTAEGALRLEERSPREVEPVDASADLPVPAAADEPAVDEPVMAEPEPAALGWRARRAAERARREEDHAAEEQRQREEAEARESAEAEERREREEAEAHALAARQAAEAEERRLREEAEARERAERDAADEARRAEEERLAEERRAAEETKRREDEERERAEEEARRHAEQEAQQRAATEADERRRADEEAKQRAEEEKRREDERRQAEMEARQQAREAKERENAEAEERSRAEEQARAEQEAAAAEAKRREEDEKSREKERQREEKEARARAERDAKEREKAEAEERRRAEEEAKIQAKREAAEAKQRAKDEKEREQREAKERAERERREAKERAEREKAQAEAAKVQAKIDAADAKQRAKDEKERAKREAIERAEREKAEAEAAKAQAKLDAAAAKQRAKDEKEREKREAVERAEREKAEAEAEKVRQKQAEVDAKQRAEEEKRRAKEREREEKEARRRAEQEAKEAARAERERTRKEKQRDAEAPKPADDGKRGFGRRRREVVEEPEPTHVPDVVSRIQQYGMAAPSNDSPTEPPEQQDDE